MKGDWAVGSMKTLYFSLPGSHAEVAGRVGQALRLEWNHRADSEDAGSGGWTFVGAGMKIGLSLNADHPAFGDCAYALTVGTAYADVDGLGPGLPEQTQLSAWIGLTYATELAEKLEVPIHYESGCERIIVTLNPDRGQWKAQGPRALVASVPLQL